MSRQVGAGARTYINRCQLIQDVEASNLDISSTYTRTHVHTYTRTHVHTYNTLHSVLNTLTDYNFIVINSLIFISYRSVKDRTE